MAAEFKYEKVAQLYAQLIKEGKRTLDSIPNEEIRARVIELLVN